MQIAELQWPTRITAPTLAENLRDAWLHLMQAQQNFHEAHLTAEIDAAIYEWRAAELRYGVLLRRVKEEAQ